MYTIPVNGDFILSYPKDSDDFIFEARGRRYTPIVLYMFLSNLSRGETARSSSFISMVLDIRLKGPVHREDRMFSMVQSLLVTSVNWTEISTY